jgi:CIC family chloride channel protein
VLSGGQYPLSLTLGSGASGGIFSPSLFLGATLGSAYGVVLQRLAPGLAISPPALAVTGMAAMVGGATGAAMAAIVMIFEMTLDYNVVLPMTIAVAISWGVRKVLSAESIYTTKLVRRGRFVPEGLHTMPQFVRRAKEIMSPKPGVVAASSTLQDFAKLAGEQSCASLFVVGDQGRIAGYIRDDMRIQGLGEGGKTVTLGEIARTDFTTVGPDTTLLDILAKMAARHASVALVTEGPGLVADTVRGVITGQEIADVTVQAATRVGNLPS